MTRLCSMREALSSPDLFGREDMMAGETWAPWRVLLIAIMGEPLTAEERETFRVLTGREIEPGSPVDEFWAVIGRRGGKTRAVSILAAYLAALVEHRHVLAPGQWGLLPVMAASVQQAQEGFNYLNGVFTAVPMLSDMVESRTVDTLSLTSRVTIAVRAASFRTGRGPTYVGAICDEIAYWRSDDSANPDAEILAAIRPGLATTGGPLICISSPYARRGELYEAYAAHHGPKGDPLIIVAKAPSRVTNPSLPQRVVDRAYEKDAAKASAEYGGEFREDMEAFVGLDVVKAATAEGRIENMPARGLEYRAFVDTSGGSGDDTMTLAIAHRVDRDHSFMLVLDLVREVKAPFSPDEIVGQFAAILARYGVREVTGDNYAAEWPRGRFRVHGIEYKRSERNRSAIYLELLPLLNAGRIELLDIKKLRTQLVSLERSTTKSGRDSINHPSGGHDDLINSAAGALTLFDGTRQMAGHGFFELARIQAGREERPEPIAKTFARGSLENP